MQTLCEDPVREAVLPPVQQLQSSEQTEANEHVTPPKASNKRLVSKRRYAANVGKKVALSSASLGLLLVASCALLGTFLLVDVLLSPARPLNDFGQPHEAPPFIIGSGLTALLCYFLAWLALKKSSNVETGVPLTRANTGDLPAPASLVRASAEPVQAQEAVLLRAATQASETPAEQLVRPAGGQE